MMKVGVEQGALENRAGCRGSRLRPGHVKIEPSDKAKRRCGVRVVGTRSSVRCPEHFLIL